MQTGRLVPSRREATPHEWIYTILAGSSLMQQNYSFVSTSLPDFIWDVSTKNPNEGHYIVD